MCKRFLNLQVYSKILRHNFRPHTECQGRGRRQLGSCTPHTATSSLILREYSSSLDWYIAHTPVHTYVYPSSFCLYVCTLTKYILQTNKLIGIRFYGIYIAPVSLAIFPTIFPSFCLLTAFKSFFFTCIMSLSAAVRVQCL